jgi:hypothetical protein
MAVGTLTNLDVTEDYADGKQLTEAQLQAQNTSIETSVNTTLMRNLEQLAKDAYGNANYTFNSDGNASLTNTLFDKQYVESTYNGGDISIGTSADVSWTAVDGVNAVVSITPEIIGTYRATFVFTHRATSTATTEMEADVGFRITDGTTASAVVNSGGYVPATAANSGELSNVITISKVFNFTTASSKTVTLQKFVRTATALSANVVNALAANGELYMAIEKV